MGAHLFSRWRPFSWGVLECAGTTQRTNIGISLRASQAVATLLTRGVRTGMRPRGVCAGGVDWHQPLASETTLGRR